VVRVEVEVSRAVIGEAQQSNARLTTDVHSVHQTARHHQRHLVMVFRTSRHVQHQRQVHLTKAFYRRTQSHRISLGAAFLDCRLPAMVTVVLQL